MDEEIFNKALADRFEGFELVELLDISVEDIIEHFPETISENREFLEDYLNYGR